MFSRRNWKVWISLVFLFVGAWVTVNELTGRTSWFPEWQRDPRVSVKAIPDFKLQDRSGRRFRLRDEVGKVVVLHLWGSWCPPCVPEIPEWVEFIHRAYEKDPSLEVQFVTVSVDESWEKADKVLPPSRVHQKVRELLDPGAKIASQLGSFQFPETYVIGKDQEVVAKWIGPQDWRGKWGEDAMEGLRVLSRQDAQK
jgi:peroxiredoxin